MLVPRDLPLRRDHSPGWYLKLFRVWIALSCFCPLSLSAQQASQLSAAHTVTIDVTVTDKSGKAVRGLRQEDFTLLEDKRQKDLTSFRVVNLDAGTPAPPIEMDLVVDGINADIWKMGRQREGVKNFLRANGGGLPLPVSLWVLNDRSPGHPVAASRDGNALAAMLDKEAAGLREVRQNTFGSAFDRFQLSLRSLNAIIVQLSPRPGRKLIVWVSPGWPLLANAASDVTGKDQQQLFREIVDTSLALRDNHMTLYHVEARGVAGSDVGTFSYYKQFLEGVKSPSQAYPANLSLSVLAVQSGGLVLNQSNDLPAVMATEISKASSDARSFYVLQFESAPAEKANEYHALQVKLDKPGLTARTRTGYYAEP